MIPFCINLPTCLSAFFELAGSDPRKGKEICLLLIQDLFLCDLCVLCSRNLRKNGGNDFLNALYYIRLIGHRLGHGDLAGAAGLDALDDQLAGVDQEAG